ncbi:MAG: hypothetical protein HUJ26_18565 [Planctomycetaceae bacterium]|nr:hypothetical protein [Planctomycetaceae bacterium]
MRRLERKLAVVMGVAMISLAVRPAPAADEMIEKSLSYFPAHTNSVMVMNVDQIKQSEKAKQAGWSDNSSSMWVAGTEPLPSWVKTIVRGAHTHLGRSSREWSMSVAKAPSYLNFSALARHYGQKTQTVAGQPSYLSPSGAYVAMLNQDTIGVLRPADRADLSRWINQVQTESDPVLPQYLQDAAQQSGHILMAVDLKDTFDKWLLRSWLESTETLKGSSSRVLEMAELLQHLEGLTLTVNVTDDIHAKLQFDFDTTLTPIADQFHPLLLEYLTHSSAFVSDLESAKVDLQGTAIVMTMSHLSDSGFQRLMSLILSPHPQQTLAANEDNKSEQPNNDSPVPRSEPSLAATQKYFLAIENLLGDLERSYKRSRNYTATAVWHERFAQKIDNLPIEKVDPAMVKYGRETSARLVALGASLRGQPLEINALNNSITYNVKPTYGGNGWWGGVGTYTADGPVPSGYDVDTNLTQVREKQAQAVIAGGKERQQLWQIQIDARNEIRSDMYQKYEVDISPGSEDE